MLRGRTGATPVKDLIFQTGSLLPRRELIDAAYRYWNEANVYGTAKAKIGITLSYKRIEKVSQQWGAAHVS